MGLSGSAPAGGHYAASKTMYQVQRRAYWATWKSDVKYFCLSCVECATNHRGNPSKKMRYCYELVRKQLNKCAERRKHVYDLHVKPQKFQVGQFVFCYSPRKAPGPCPKWAKNFVGSYLIVRIIEPVNVVIQKSKGSKLITVHIDKLKLYHGPELKPCIVFYNNRT